MTQAALEPAIQLSGAVTGHSPELSSLIALVGSGPVTADSPRLDRLIALIGEDASRRDSERVHPYDALALARHARLGALRLPVSEGGGGSTLRELIEVTLRLGAADPNVAHSLRNHFTFVERFGIDERAEKYRKWRQAIANGAFFGLALTETDSKQIGYVEAKTSLTPDGDGYRLNGTKYYSTGSLYADYILTRAAKPDGIHASIVVPVKRDGVELVDDWDGIGQRVTGSGTTNFHNVRIEADEVTLDSEDGGFYSVAYAGTLAQLYVTAIIAGILRAIVADASALVRSRNRPFYYAPSDKTTEDPILQRTVGEISSYAFAVENAVLAAADALDAVPGLRAQGKPDEEASEYAALLAAKAKVVTDELTLKSASLLFDVGGASTATRRKNFDRHWRNARTLASHNPAAYKARAIGDFEINDTPLPTKGFF